MGMDSNLQTVARAAGEGGCLRIHHGLTHNVTNVYLAYCSSYSVSALSYAILHFSLTLTNLTIENTVTDSNGRDGGAVFGDARVVTLDRISIRNCTSVGGSCILVHNVWGSLRITNLDVSECHHRRRNPNEVSGGIMFADCHGEEVFRMENITARMNDQGCLSVLNSTGKIGIRNLFCEGMSKDSSAAMFAYYSDFEENRTRLQVNNMTLIGNGIQSRVPCIQTSVPHPNYTSFEFSQLLLQRCNGT
eukprot:PhF_6_TR44270/c0_g1_i6/m.68201